jgi:single-strand DNA-binding protein
MKHKNEHTIIGTVSDHYGVKSLSKSRVCEFRVECDFGKYKNWLKVKAWNEAAELAGNLAKGSLVEVVGQVQTRSYDDKEGKKQYVTETVVNDASGIRILDAVEMVASAFNAKPAESDDIPF